MIWYSQHWVAFLMYVPISLAAILWVQVTSRAPTLPAWNIAFYRGVDTSDFWHSARYGILIDSINACHHHSYFVAYSPL